MNRLVLPALLICCLTQSLRAELLTFKDLLAQYQARGYSLIYSTGLVDASKIIIWDGDLSINFLRRSLETIGPGFKEVEQGLWLIQRISENDESTQKAEYEASNLSL